jgi:hypothetical protein
MYTDGPGQPLLSSGSLALASLDRACRNHCPDVSATLTTTAFDRSNLRLGSAPDRRTRRALLHLSNSCASPCGPATLVTHDPSGHRRTAQNSRYGLTRLPRRLARQWRAG